MTPETYYVRVGKYKEYLHIELEGREGEALCKHLAGVLLPDKEDTDARTAKVRCYRLASEHSTTAKLGFDLGSNQFKINDINVGGFR